MWKESKAFPLSIDTHLTENKNVELAYEYQFHMF